MRDVSLQTMLQQVVDRGSGGSIDGSLELEERKANHARLSLVSDLPKIVTSRRDFDGNHNPASKSPQEPLIPHGRLLSLHQSMILSLSMYTFEAS